MASQRLRAVAVAACACAGLSVAAGPAGAAARPTISAAPNPTTAGDQVVIFGRAPAGARVVLWHRINPRRRFTPVSRTSANALGRYEFVRADGVVNTNRNWFVRSAGRRSRTFHERVFALVTLAGPSDDTVDTGTPVTFTGTVSPAHRGERVFLQRQGASAGADRWHTIDRARIGANGAYTLVHRFRREGAANLRTVFRGDRRNLRSPSNVISLQIEQQENSHLTLQASANPLDEGQSVTLTGTLAGAGAGQPVTLLARGVGSSFVKVAETATDASGGYAFTQTPVVNTFYRVTGGGRTSAGLFEGVRDVVTASVDKTAVTAGATLTFTGSVSPDKTGHTIVLQQRNANGADWHPVKQATVGAGSTFTITRRVAAPGTKVFRVLIAGGPENQRGVSAPLTVTVTPNASPIG